MMNTQASQSDLESRVVSVRALREDDLPAANHLMRVAFGTFIGLPEPTAFMGDASLITPRWRADPTSAFGAFLGEDLVGSNVATDWGSVGFFGPLTIRPDLWDRGIGKQLMGPVMDCFAEWQTEHMGLFTFPHSTKHVAMYQRYGFWPRYLTAVMSKPVNQGGSTPGWSRFSEVPTHEREALLRNCVEVTDATYEGLDVSVEIRAVADQQLGDTVLLWEDGKLVGFAVCHVGPGTEAGSGACYVKFGVVVPGPYAERSFARLLSACEDFAEAEEALRLIAGVNTARLEAYRHMLGRGFRTDIQGVAMETQKAPGYNRPGVFLLDDWR
jgi:GNAT superfamily N-acetyltransferase